MDADKRKRVEVLARQLWAAHGFPEGCYGEFYFQASQELALAEDLSKVSTKATVARLRERNRSSAHAGAHAGARPVAQAVVQPLVRPVAPV